MMREFDAETKDKLQQMFRVQEAEIAQTKSIREYEKIILDARDRVAKLALERHKLEAELAPMLARLLQG